MIKQLFVIRNSGECIYHLNLEDNLISNLKNKKSIVDPNIISGFISAVLSFANVVEKDDGVNKLSLDNSSFYFIKDKGFHFIIQASKDDNSLTDNNFQLLLKDICDLLILYMKGENIDSSCMQIFNDDILDELIRNIVSRFIRSSIREKLLNKTNLSTIL